MSAIASSKANKLSTRLISGSPILLDGALATYLETLGADISGALWSADILIKTPSLIKQTHLDYYRAGANIAITASYQASIAGLTKHLDLDEKEARTVISKSVKLAQDARDEYVTETLTALSKEAKDKMLLVAGSVGPYGAFLADGSEYRGDYTLPNHEMKAFHRGRLQALVDANVDVLAFETMPSKGEIEALLDLLITEFPNAEAWFSFTLRDSAHISDGTPLSEIVSILRGTNQVVAVGFNCISDDLALDALKDLSPLVEGVALIVYPNSGEQWNAQAREWEGQRTEGATLEQKTVEWWNAGAKMIGGCCRTTPEDIAVMGKALESFR
ncbi:Homocysteine S-methyltransferase [Cucurbitaria berberidis CBS 394.84]|uniref:Homocysteine S-methyltransferase n=1 Tax=Cucurbitaria berberidis CBS 394.84 TaxID=1168544 RepID=A0A9P4GDR9_9PLEO|nr:Homocysteine S-methyltransferase [Cucurbitaria berberidis CBS 394.84]KAF1843752.1 Homocysteine S-methyltransferase [Cucurbitaria berberidis CBS 394.84]